MKPLLIGTIFTLISYLSFAQTEIEKANTCYTAKDYICATTNYLTSLDKKNYADKDLYLIEFRIGIGYSQTNDLKKAIEYFKRSIISQSDFLYSYWSLADACYNDYNYNAALLNYKKALDLSTITADKELIHYWMASTYYEKGNYDSSIDEYNKVTSREGILRKVDIATADAYFKQEDYETALDYYIKGQPVIGVKDSSFPNLKLYMGKCYRILYDDDKAIEQQNIALSVKPDFADAMWENGVNYSNKKDYNTAIAWYKKAINYFKENTEDYYTLSRNIANNNIYIKNYPEAINWFTKAKAASSNKYNNYAKIASIQYGRIKAYKDAEKTCMEAITAYQLENETSKTTNKYDYITLNNILGKMALEKNDTSKAIKYFETSIKLNNSNYEANAGLAEIAWAQKKESDYTKYFNNIYKEGYDTVLSSKKEIAAVYGRSAYTDAYINKLNSYPALVNKALGFDSLQKEAVFIWPLILANGPAYDLDYYRKACLSILNQSIKKYASDKNFISDLYNYKAVLLPATDTSEIRKSLSEAVKNNIDNMTAWDNVLKYYTSYDNAGGIVIVEKLITNLKKKKDPVTLSTAYIYKGDYFWRLNKKDLAKAAWTEALVWDANNATAKERIKME